MNRWALNYVGNGDVASGLPQDVRIQMAKGATVMGNDRTKVRFVFVEVDGNASAVESAIRGMTTALQGRPMALPAAQAPSPSLAAKNGNGSETPPPAVVDATTADVDDETPLPPSTDADRLERKPRKPHAYPMIDIDFKTGVPLADFAKQKQPNDSAAQRALLVALWLKLHRNTPAIGGSHIRTCFRHLDWQQPDDCTGPLRSLKTQGLFVSGGRGLYAINGTGVDEVEKWSKKS